MDLDLLPDDERQALLAAYLEGTLDDDRARDVTAWLDRHPAALREIEHQRRLWELLGRYPDESVPAGFSQRVLAASGATRVGTTARASHGRLRRWALAAAAAALVAVGATVLLRARPAAPPQPETLSIASIDLDLVQHANLEGLLTLSDDEFEALLADDPDLLANAGLGG